LLKEGDSLLGMVYVLIIPEQLVRRLKPDVQRKVSDTRRFLKLLDLHGISIHWTPIPLDVRRRLGRRDVIVTGERSCRSRSRFNRVRIIVGVWV
jgi:hypothetical protein